MKRFFPDQQKNRLRSGFTVVELVVVVAIVLVLAGISAVGLSGLQKNLTQKELDSKAQLIYAAAQNRLSQLQAAGLTSIYEGEGISKLSQGTGNSARTLCYIVKSSEPEIAEAFLPAGYLEQEIRGNQWVIEYDAGNACVYAVYYCEQTADMGYSVAARTALAAEAANGTGKIGYFQADNADTPSSETDTLHPNIRIENGEVLKAVISCPAPKDSSVRVSYRITVYDADGNPKDYPTETVTPEYDNIDKIYSYELILDAITGRAADRFANKYFDCTPGKDIVVSVEAVPTGTNSAAVDSYSISAGVNSLFASVSVDREGRRTAEITTGRHLQNLDAETVKTEISYVKQTCDIDWKAAYPTVNFIPIDNSDIDTYSGAISETESAVIYNLTVDTTGMTGVSGGLFERFYGSSIDSLRLCGAKINGGEEAAGALVGVYAGNGSLDIANCRVYLDEGELEIAGVTNQDILISGKNAGGFIGSNPAGSLTFRNCFASTVVGSASTTAGGGFVGMNTGEIVIGESYADCYISGEYAAGFVGSGDVKTIFSSYTAGYVTASQVGAGMVNGTVGNISKSYTIINFTPDCTGITSAVAESVASFDTLFYWAYGSDTNGIGRKITAEMQNTLITLLGAPFQSVSSAYSVSYDLTGKGIPEYSFPILNDMPHYGDWEIFDNERRVKWEYEEYTVDILKISGNTWDVRLDCSVEEPAIDILDSDTAVTLNAIGDLQELNENGTASENTHRVITLNILDVGSAEITASVGAEPDMASDTLVLTVTADLQAVLDRNAYTVSVNESEVLNLKAESSDGVDYTSDGELSWDFFYSNDTEHKAEIVKINDNYEITGIAEGTETITVVASIEKNGHTYSSDPITMEVTVEPTV